MQMQNIMGSKIRSTYPFLFSFYILVVIGGSSCNSTIKNYGKYMAYIAEPANGVTKEKATSGLKIRVKYLPVDYLAYSEFKNSKDIKTEEQKQALKKTYENSLTFMLTFAPDEGKKFDVTRVDVSDYEEFATRIEDMNFNFSNYIKLETEGEEIRPELSQMESTYGLEKKRNIILVFNKNEIKDNIRIIYKDEIFGTGTHKFLFQQDDLLAVPQFVF